LSRVSSPENIKGSRRGYFRGTMPRVGSKLRELWDLLHAYKGVPFEDELTMRFPNTAISQLTDFYGLDIRNLGSTCRGQGMGRGKGRSKWLLAGEWIDGKYHDYVAEKKSNMAKVEKILMDGKP
jgi:hypothetical protein